MLTVPKVIKLQIKQKFALIMVIVWFSTMWSWAFFADVLNLAGSKQQGYWLALLIVAINVCLSVSALWLTFKLLKYIHVKFNTRVLFLVGLPLLAFADFLASWLSAIIWIGPQGQVTNVLPMGSFALVLINTPFKYASRIVGFYGLASFLWFFLFLVFQRSYRRLAILPVILLTTISIVGWFLFSSSGDRPIKTKIVSETLTNRVPAIDSDGADLVVFPEYGLENINNSNLEDRIKKTDNKQKKSYFLGSAQIYSKSYTGHINNMMFGDTANGITQSEHKWRLIPGGEDLPYILRIMLRATSQKSTLDYFSYAKGVIKGGDQLKPFIIDDDVQVGAAVCSSIIAPEDYRDFTQAGATVFTNSASLSIFNRSKLFLWQQKSLARFMAVANARYFLQSANASTAYVLDLNGKQIAEVDGHNVLDVSIYSNKNKTLYTQSGEWLAWLGFAILTGMLLLNYKRILKRIS